jgi:NAD(P)H dehydrogenase (quinone)
MARIVVTGASGHLGGATVNHLLNHVPAGDIAVLARTAEKVSSLAARGVSVAIGDYFDKDSLVRAFRGAEKVLLIGSPAHSDRALQQQNMIEAVKAAGVGHAVYIGLQRKEGSGAKIAAVTDVEIAAEEALKSSGVPFTIVRNTVYIPTTFGCETSAPTSSAPVSWRSGPRAKPPTPTSTTWRSEMLDCCSRRGMKMRSIRSTLERL